MKIVLVEPIVLSQRLNEAFSFSQWRYETRSICLVKVTLEDGTVGWGEGYGPAALIERAIQFFAPFIVGKDGFAIGVRWQEMYRRSLDYARSGVFLAGLSAIDIALWDAWAKALNRPLHELLGGARRPAIPLYATGLYFDPLLEEQPERLAAEALSYVRQGFPAIKMKVGMSPKIDLMHVEAVRAQIGPEVRLMVDSNHAYSRREATDLIGQLRPFDITWFEEPLSPEDYRGYAELRRQSPIAIAGGECEYLVHGFRRLMEAEAVDIVQPDLCACGGLTEGLRIAALARAYGVAITPHCWGTQIARAVAAHFTSTIDPTPGRAMEPDTFLECDCTENNLRDEATTTSHRISDGRLHISSASGHGAGFCEERAQHFIPNS
jgi:D-galactarolactone cycloisomerase